MTSTHLWSPLPGIHVWFLLRIWNCLFAWGAVYLLSLRLLLPSRHGDSTIVPIDYKFEHHERHIILLYLNNYHFCNWLIVQVDAIKFIGFRLVEMIRNEGEGTIIAYPQSLSARRSSGTTCTNRRASCACAWCHRAYTVPYPA